MKMNLGDMIGTAAATVVSMRGLDQMKDPSFSDFALVIIAVCVFFYVASRLGEYLAGIAFEKIDNFFRKLRTQK